MTEIRSAMIRPLLSHGSIDLNSSDKSHNSKLIQHVNIKNTMQTLWCCKSANVWQCFSQQVLWALLGHKNETIQAHKKWVSDVLLFSSVEFDSVSLFDCGIIGRILRWLVQTSHVVAYSFAFDSQKTLGLILSTALSWIWIWEAPLEVSGYVAVVRVVSGCAWLSCWLAALFGITVRSFTRHPRLRQ